MLLMFIMYSAGGIRNGLQSNFVLEIENAYVTIQFGQGTPLVFPPLVLAGQCLACIALNEIPSGCGIVSVILGGSPVQTEKVLYRT